MAAFITLPIGDRGRGGEVTINVEEIASYRGYQATTSYSFEDRTEVVLKNGVTHNCRVSREEVERQLRVLEAELQRVVDRASESGA